MDAFAPDWSSHQLPNQIGYFVDADDPALDSPTPTLPNHLSSSNLSHSTQLSLGLPPSFAPFEAVSLGPPIDLTSHECVPSTAGRSSSSKRSSSPSPPPPISSPPSSNPSGTHCLESNPRASSPEINSPPALSRTALDHHEPRENPPDSHPQSRPQPSSSSSSSPGPTTPADLSHSIPQKPDENLPVSEMAPPPQPAEKSRAGKKALAAIQGGGGLGVRGTKPNVLQKVISKTRPKDLPPKPPEEDQKHLKEFGEMMAASLEMQKRQSQLEAERKLAREQLIASYQSTWEKDVLPNWKSVLRDDASGNELRKMWWIGTMPARHRGRLWLQCIGNAGAVGRSAFMKSVALAHSLINSTPTRFPPDVLQAIDEDILQTMPRLKLFQEDRPMHSDLKQVLLAWSVFWRERPFYPPGSSHVAALFLINMNPPDAFLSLVNITRKSCLSSFYNRKQGEIEGFYRIFENIFSESMPKLYKNFRQREIPPGFYLEPWIRSVYVSHLPIELSTRIMDVFVLEGDSFLFRVALALLETLEARLYNPDREELRTVLKGEDRGSRMIVIRNSMFREGATQRSLDEVGVDESYEEMGCNEENVFKNISNQNWNEVLWDRLLSRELPD